MEFVPALDFSSLTAALTEEFQQNTPPSVGSSEKVHHIQPSVLKLVTSRADNELLMATVC